MGLIELKDAVKKYDIGKETEVAALAGTSLTIEKGEMIAITGPSGSGKTTLLKIIAGIEKLSSGQYCWNGQDVETMKEKETCRLRNTDIGFISQDYSLLEEESTLFNVCLPQMIGGRHTKENRSNAMKVMDEVGLMGLYRKPAGKLSGGQKQRVAIARALNMNAQVILADEPTGALDRENTILLMELLQKINREKGLTILIVTHDPLVAEVCMKEYHLVDGKIIC
ncbi:MAG: ABC transporter ATP-binding protein [Firmicutes bacterium]|nr:ABC transporter ATP-binding protein [Bacillota bacterium]